MTRPSGDTPVATEPPSIAARLTSLERVMGVVDSRVDDQQLRSARDVTRQITERLSLSPAHTVVALAGATGSGKSSIYNALAGLDLSEVGVRRPVTNAPHACVWGPDGAGPLLDWLSIPYDNRTGRESALDADSQAELRGLVLLDLPDHDSTQLAHRLEVDRLVELVDLLVWVLDPQKYADEAVHSRYLRRLSRHAGVTVVVLNQVDLLSSADAEACLADVRRLLDADGLRGVPLVPLSALRGDGLPELKERITTTVASRQASVRRLAADLDDVADELAPLAGPEVREDVDRSAAKRLYTTLAEAAGATAVGEAVERGYKFTASRTLGWPLIHWFGRTKADPLAPLRENAGKAPRTRARTTARPAALHPVQRPQVEEALRHLADDTAHALPAPWPRLVHRAARSEIDQLPDALDRAVATADLGLARRPTWWWAYRIVQYLLVLALFGGVVWALGLAIAAVVGGSGSALSGSDLVAPLVLLMGGLVLGPVLHVVGMVLTGRGARSARLRAEQAVLDAVTTVARERVLAPVRAELSAYAVVRDALIDFGVQAPSRAGSSASPDEGDASVLGEDSVSKDAHDGLGPLPPAAGYPDPFRQSATLNASAGSDVGVVGSRPEVDEPESTPTQGAPLKTDAGVPEPETGQPMTGQPIPGRPAPNTDWRAPGQDGTPQTQPWRPAPPQPADARVGTIPPPPRPEAVRHGAIPPAPTSPPLAPGVRPFLSAHTPPPPTVAPRTPTPQAPSYEPLGQTSSQGQPGQASSYERPTPASPREASAPTSGATPTGARPSGGSVRGVPGARLPGDLPVGPVSGMPGAAPTSGQRRPAPIDGGTVGAPGGPPGAASMGGPSGAASAGGSEGSTARPARRSGPKLPPAPPPRPAVEADPEVVWARTRPTRPGADGSGADGRNSGGSASDAVSGRDSGVSSGRGSEKAGGSRGERGSGEIDLSARGSAESDGVFQPQRKGLRGLFSRRKESADVVDRWWATTDDGDDPFGRPGADSSDDSRRQRPVPDQR